MEIAVVVAAREIKKQYKERDKLCQRKNTKIIPVNVAA